MSLSADQELELAHPTPAELQKIWSLIETHTPWSDGLSASQFLLECAYLQTVPLARDGGMKAWMLVPKNSVPDERPIFASCESLKKTVLVSSGGGKGAEEGLIYGVASVFCSPEHRGNGYAKVMLTKLAGVWKGEEGVRGSVLYSDIGRKYYGSIGWGAAPNNRHVEFPAIGKQEEKEERKEIEGVRFLQADDLETLCGLDEKMVREDFAKEETGGTKMMILPTVEHMRWHHSKEDFVAKILFDGKIPVNKGVMSGEVGKRIWVIWTHRFYHAPSSEGGPSGNVMYILRLVIENIEQRDEDELKGSLEKVFKAAQEEAKRWGLDIVKIWDPNPVVQKLVGAMDEVKGKVVERKDEGIASLFWFGEEEVEWVGNEKFAWC